MKKNSNNNDSELVEKVKKGNKMAFNFLMNKYYSRVYASLFSFTKSHEDSEDLTQMTFLKVWQQITTFRGDSAFFTWAYRIAINLAKNYVSSANFKKQKINTSIEDADIEIKSFDNTELSLIHEQSLHEIRHFIDSLPESLRTAFTLREHDGLSYEEIGEITNTPIGTVRSRIFRARESILDFINKEIIRND
tara:strand:- start:2180 stop:2755 length:576 start_codon:yes stop_codon:yes gene_type:complete